MNYYLTVKFIHIACAIGSISLFVVRGIWAIWQSNAISRRWVRIVPHIIDSVLLFSVVLLMIELQQYPFVNDWLTAKITAVLFYIGLGLLVFRFSASRRVKLIVWVLALLVLVYIIWLALTHVVVPAL